MISGYHLEQFRQELNLLIESEDKARSIRNNIACSGSPHVNAEDVEALADATVVGLVQVRRVLEQLLQR